MNAQQKLHHTLQRTKNILLDVSFNNDQSCFAIGCEKGLCVYGTDPLITRTVRDFKLKETKSLSKLNEFQAVGQDMDLTGYDNNQKVKSSLTSLPYGKGVGLVKLLLKTNYLAIVGGGKNPLFPTNKLHIWDESKGQSILVFEFPTPVLNCAISKNHIVVALMSQTIVYSFSMNPKLISRFDTTENEHGILDLAITSDSVQLAFPARNKGQIRLFELLTEEQTPNQKGNVTILKAHKSQLKLIKISRSGRMIASASEVGTLIRIHDTRTGALIFEFRRGLDKVSITSMAFSKDDSLLSVLSDKNTLHVFKLKSLPANNKTFPLDNIPLPVPSYFHSTWSFVSQFVGNELYLNETGELGWTDDSSVVIIWKVRGIWEKWHLIPQEQIADAGSSHWELIKSGWKSLELFNSMK